MSTTCIPMAGNRIPCSNMWSSSQIISNRVAMDGNKKIMKKSKCLGMDFDCILKLYIICFHLPNEPLK